MKKFLETFKVILQILLLVVPFVIIFLITTGKINLYDILFKKAKKTKRGIVKDITIKDNEKTKKYVQELNDFVTTSKDKLNGMFKRNRSGNE